MNGNGNGKDESTIKPCPMPGCGGDCSVEKASPPQDDSTYYYVVRCDNFCGYVCQLLDTEPAAIASHNELCERDEKGRWADEAVWLLRRAKNCISIVHEVRIAIDRFLARDDIKKIGGGR